MDADELRRLIAAKREGLPLPADRWEALVSAYVEDRVDEAQIAALLMASTLRGLDDAETLALTRAMVASGETLTYACRPVLDKHSSGGVGDSVSLLAVPIVAAAGVHVAKLAGRALGHTGGTIDKLEALPGVRTAFEPAQFVALVEQVGCAIAAQSDRLVPADRKLYALRDRTATVPSIGLIAASIVSKKIAAGADAIVYDVKVGRGAFMQTFAEGQALAARILALTNAFGRRARVYITDMSEPLGRMIGDGLEALEVLSILRGERSLEQRLPTLALKMAKAMLDLAGVEADTQQLVTSGAALASFEKMLSAQGANLSAIPGLKPLEPHVTIYAPQAGYVTTIDPIKVGEAARALVARCGSYAGLELHVQVGDQCSQGDPLLTVYGDHSAERYVSLMSMNHQPPSISPLIYQE